MPLDHYISQVYLRKFLAPDLENRMHAMRKSDLSTFAPRTRDVCRTPDGNTNRHLQESRAIEAFLEDVAPRFNAAYDRFAEGEPRQEDIYSLAGLLSYFLTCSPGAMRINAEPLRAHVEAAARVMDEQGAFDDAPETLGGGTLTDILDDGRVGITVDPQYPAAIGTAGIFGRVSLFGNGHWDVLINQYERCGFFTSDYPIAIEDTPDPQVLARILPLSPTVAVRITPDSARRRADPDFNFPGFRYLRSEISAAEARRINQLLVRSAEDLVFAADWDPWRPQFVERHRHYRIETVTNTVPVPGGEMLHFRAEILPFQRC